MTASCFRWCVAFATTVAFFGQFLSWGMAAETGPLRTWRDDTGKFTLEARLLQCSETDVQLRTAAGREISVPRARLSESDRRYLADLARPADSGDGTTAAKPPGPELMARDTSIPSAADRAVLPGDGPALTLTPGEPPRELAADPSADQQAWPYGEFEVSPVDAYDHVGRPFLMDRATGLVALSIGRHKINEPNTVRGRIFIGRLPQGPAELAWEVAEGAELADFEPLSGRAVVISGFDHFQRGGDLVLLDGLATGKPQPLLRRQPPGMDKPGFKPQVAWARLLSREHLAAVVDSSLYLWNLRTAQLLYRLEKVDGTHLPALSPNRRYLAVPGPGGAHLLDAADGRSLGFVSFGGTLTPHAVFHPEGQQIALAESNQLLVWDFVHGQALCQATLAGIVGKPLGWVAPNSLLTASGQLIRTDLEMAVWSYSLPPGTDAACASQGIFTARKTPSCAVASLPVPHPAAVAAAKELERGGETMMLVRPETKVALDAEVPAGVDRAAVIAALRQGLESTGWQVVDRADITVVAQIGQGAEQTLSYRSMGPGQSLATAPITTATIKPFTAELQIRRGGEVLWTRKTQNHVPHMLHMKQGQTLQDAVKEFERPNPEFYARLTIPPRIPRPEIANGLGRSMLEGAQWRDLPAVKALPKTPVRRPGFRA